MSDQTIKAAPSRFPCAQCGAALAYSPGAQALTCGHCGFVNQAPASDAPVAEQDFEEALRTLEGKEDLIDAVDVRCDSCGAMIHGAEGRTSTRCAFCDAPVVTTGLSKRLIKPHALLPFKFTHRQAAESFIAWLGRLWWAPGDLKRVAQVEGRLSGIYLPAWTFDSDATTSYTGQRGDAYYVSVPYTTTVNGRIVQQTRQERRVRWSPRSGTVFNRFDDLLVLASDSLPPEMVRDLEPWDLAALVPYADEFLSGFGAESYRLDLKGGFGAAQELMSPEIEMSIRGDIGGDEQRVSSRRTGYTNIRFKHLLLPVWVAAYRYRGKPYRFLVNARTGEVRGQRPYSAAKIALAVIAALVGMAIVLAVVAAVRG